MALHPQDDTGLVAGANAYLSVSAFRAYHDDRAQDYTGHDEATIAAAIVRATDYLDQRFVFIGRRRHTGQSTAWPREGAYDADGRRIDGIPPAVREACAEYALRALSAPLNPDPMRDESGSRLLAKSEQVGPITTAYTYAADTVPPLPAYPAADRRLLVAGLLRTDAAVAMVRG